MLSTLVSKIFQRKIEENHRQPNPDALYAFRTIITILSLLRSTTAIPDKSARKQKDVGLKVLDALSAIIIREHGIAAVVAKAPDDDSTESSTSTAPITVDPKPITHHLEDSDKPAELLDNILQHVWHKPDEETFGTHVWMLNKLLERSGYHPRALQFYVIVSCYKKLISRMDHRISRIYRTALENVQNIQLFREFHKPMDKMQNGDTVFAKYLRDIKPHLGIEIPHLMQEVDNHNFYTHETCNEFHLLLCRLLALFSDTLSALGKLREDHADTARIRSQLDLITRIGSTLMLMIKSAAMKRHLLVISKFLPGNTVFVKQTEFDPNRPGEGVDADAEFYSIQPVDDWHQSLPNSSQACSNWLELMVIHFEAVQHLAGFVNSVPSAKLIIQILSQSPPDRYMLPWRMLLEHKVYFPEDDPLCSVANIISFLRPDPKSIAEDDNGADNGEDIGADNGDDLEKLSAEVLVQRLKEIGNIPKSVSTVDGPKSNQDAFIKAVEPIIETVRRHGLTNCTSSASASHTEIILEELETFRDSWRYRDSVPRINRIVKMIYVMRDNAMLNWALRDDGPLSTGVGFSGNYHAEAVLSAFCSQSEQGFGRGLGVSEWCCPVCAHLLTQSGLLIFTNQHSAFSACSLPHGLPKDVIDSMIKFFGAQLRKELENLKMRTKILRVSRQD